MFSSETTQFDTNMRVFFNRGHFYNLRSPVCDQDVVLCIISQETFLQLSVFDSFEYVAL